jgi:hypothetical protein
VAEKLRALLQSRERLAERGWGASRVCRDYYDLWSVLKREGRLEGRIPDLVIRKNKVRNVSCESAEAFLAEELLAVARREWKQQLLPFVPNAPFVEKVLMEVRPFILALWEKPHFEKHVYLQYKCKYTQRACGNPPLDCPDQYIQTGFQYLLLLLQVTELKLCPVGSSSPGIGRATKP